MATRINLRAKLDERLVDVVNHVRNVVEAPKPRELRYLSDAVRDRVRAGFFNAMMVSIKRAELAESVEVPVEAVVRDEVAVDAPEVEAVSVEAPDVGDRVGPVDEAKVGEPVEINVYLGGGRDQGSHAESWVAAGLSRTALVVEDSKSRREAVRVSEPVVLEFEGRFAISLYTSEVGEFVGRVPNDAGVACGFRHYDGVEADWFAERDVPFWRALSRRLDSVGLSFGSEVDKSRLFAVLAGVLPVCDESATVVLTFLSSGTSLETIMPVGAMVRKVKLGES